jgi:sarcosine oxidase subunit alpha
MPRISDPRFAPDCAIEVDGTRVPARKGESVTSALLAAGRPLLARSAKYHRPRGPFCLSASCASCLVRVDGTPNVRACETPCRDGMKIETQNAVGGAARDLLGVVDLLAPNGIDHHHMATWSQVANKLAVSASRRLAGLGLLPDGIEAPWPTTTERFDAIVVGSGPAGLGAAEALANAGRRVLLCERERAIGGRLRCRLDLPGDPPFTWIREVADAIEAAGGEVVTGASALALWRDEAGHALVALPERESRRMRVATAPRAVLATGTWAQRPLFDGNDLPGIYGARGLAVALAEDGVLPGERAVVLGGGREAEAVAGRLRAGGMHAELAGDEVVKAHGRRQLARVALADGRTIACDTLAVATPRAPAAELAREAGAALELDPLSGAAWVKTDAAGLVAPGVFAAGEVTGPCSAAEAAEAGRRAGEAAARG